MQRSPDQHPGVIFVRRKDDLHGNACRKHHNQDCGRAQEKAVAQAAQSQWRDDRNYQYQRGFMGEGESEEHKYHQRRTREGAPGIVAEGKRWPEHRMRDPHLGGKAKNQGAQQRCGATRVGEDDAAR